MQRILITGGNGLLGQKLIAHYQKNDQLELIVTAKKANPNLKGNFQYQKMDITSSREVKQVISLTNPDVIIHTAAMTNVDQCELDPQNCWRINVEAMEYLIDSALRTNSFFVHLSTDFVFDGKNAPYKENDTPSPLNKYAESKLESERLLGKSDVVHAIVRTMLVYGVVPDMSRSNIVLWVKENLEQGKEIKVVNDQWRTPTLAEDLAKGCALVVDKRAKGVFHISGKDLLSPYDIAISTADFFGLDKSFIHEVNASMFSQPAQRPPKTRFILDKAREELGYEPVSFQQGLETLKSQLN